MRINQKLITLFAVFLLCTSSIFIIIPTATASSMPAGIILYVPITIANAQSSVVSGGTPVRLNMNWSLYSAYLDNPVDNIAFYNSTWDAMYSWIENGTAKTDQNSVVWLKLDPAGIAATSSITVYLGIYSISTNKLSSSSYSGANPQYSSTYGQYDNGASVFSYYTNFTSLTGWTTVTGSPVANKGITIPALPNCGIYLSTAYNPQTYTFDTNASIGIQSGTKEKNIGWINGGTYSIGYDWYTDGTNYIITNQNGGTWPTQTYSPTTAGNTWRVFSTFANSSLSRFQLNYQTPNDYASGFSSQTSLNPWYISQTYRSVSAQWARLRITPPLGINPTVTFGGAVATEYVTFYTNGNSTLYVNGVSVSNGSTVAYTNGSALTLSAIIAWNFTLTTWTSTVNGNTTNNPYSYTVPFSNDTIWLYVTGLQSTYDSGYSAGWAAGNSTGYSSGWSSGNSTGYTNGYNIGWTAGNATGWNAGWAIGNNTGYNAGWAAGNSTGYTNGYSNGYSSGYSIGYGDGYSIGYTAGNSSGYTQGWNAGNSSGYTQGWNAGNNTGYTNGYNNGYVDGWATGNSTGYGQGWTSGNYTGYTTGWASGNQTGWIQGNQTGYTTGYDIGYDLGYDAGLEAGGGTTTYYAIARFTWNPANPSFGDSITLDASISENNTAIIWYYWDFNDTQTYNSTSPTVTHAFTGEQNVFNITLTIQADDITDTTTNAITFGSQADSVSLVIVAVLMVTVIGGGLVIFVLFRKRSGGE